jgi:protein TonB
MLKILNPKGNRLFRAMIVLSVLIHVGLFLHISGLYKKAALTVLEVSMEDEFKPATRAIPRPRLRPKAPETTDVALPAMTIPRFDMVPENTAASREIMETVAAPPAQGERVEELSGLFASDTQGLFSKNDYYDMVRMKIEAAKVYPENARNRMVEGKVTVKFTITLDGQVGSIAVATSSGNRQLDQAAVKAVSDASPYARPPGALFKGPLRMEITIAFELT